VSQRAIEKYLRSIGNGERKTNNVWKDMKRKRIERIKDTGGRKE
jgi:hypothetical protein